MSIPHIVHRIWLGGDLPAAVKRYGESWARHLPGWEVRTWREWDLPPLINQDAFDRAALPAQQADLARLEILFRYGGVYVDTDFEARSSLEPLLDGVSCFVSREDEKFIATGIIGAEPAHPFIGWLLERVGRSIADQPEQPPNRQSGPYFVTAELRRYRTADKGAHPVTVFPPERFYPYHFSQPERRNDEFPDAVAVHHWSGSWTN